MSGWVYGPGGEQLFYMTVSTPSVIELSPDQYTVEDANGAGNTEGMRALPDVVAEGQAGKES